jgi:hypothetical protein
VAASTRSSPFPTGAVIARHSFRTISLPELKALLCRSAGADAHFRQDPMHIYADVKDREHRRGLKTETPPSIDRHETRTRSTKPIRPF